MDKDGENYRRLRLPEEPDPITEANTAKPPRAQAMMPAKLSSWRGGAEGTGCTGGGAEYTEGAKLGA